MMKIATSSAPHRRTLAATALLGALFALAGCGGSDATIGPDTTPGPSVAGNWSGQWMSKRNQGGALSAELATRGDAVSGDFKFVGSPCFAAAHLDGTQNGRNLDGRASFGQAYVAITATVSDDAINGTYSIGGPAGLCTGDSGTFFLSR